MNGGIRPMSRGVRALNASVFGDRDRNWMRWVIASVLLMDIWFLRWAHFVEPAPANPEAYWPEFLYNVHTLSPLVSALLCVAAVSAVTFAMGKRTLLSGTICLAALVLLVESYTAHIGGPRRRYYTTGAVLGGWLFGLWAARRCDANESAANRFAEAAATGALVATYSGAAIQKLQHGVFSDGVSFRGTMLEHLPVDHPPAFRAMVETFVQHPSIAIALISGVVCIQALSVLYLMSRRLRMLWGTALICFHLGTLALLNIIYLEATLLFLAFSYPWQRWLTIPAESAPPTANVTLGRLLTLLGTTGILVLFVAQLPAPHAVPRRPDPVVEFRPLETPAAPAPTEVDAIQGLQIGQVVADRWTVAGLAVLPESYLSIRVSDDSATLVFGASGPSGGAPEGPFSVGDLHLFYETNPEVEPGSFDAPGAALVAALSAGNTAPGVALDAAIAAVLAAAPQTQAQAPDGTTPDDENPHGTPHEPPR